MNVQEQQQFLAHWEQTRRKGAFRYILFTGLSWGTFSAVAIRFLMFLLAQDFSLEGLTGTFKSREFLVYWGVFLLGGLCYSLTMWFYFGWLYRKYRKKDETAA